MQIKKLIPFLAVCSTLTCAYAGTFYNNGQAVTGPQFVPQVNQQYIILNQKPVTQKSVLEFFSFYCPHCYNFEFLYKIPEKIRAHLPKGATFAQYTVNSFGMQSKSLSRAWAYAIANNLTQKVEKPLFNAVIDGEISSMNNIATVFQQSAGITKKTFMSSINDFLVNGIVTKQVNLAKLYNIKFTPTFIINGKYEIRPQGFENATSYQQFAKEYTATVLYLLNK